MALNSLDGLSQLREVVTWETASDWDGATSDTVVHEAFGDLPGSDVLVLGYPSDFWSLGTPEFYLPLDESSGNATDVSANARSVTASGDIEYDQTGLHNTTAQRFDSDDRQIVTNWSKSLPITFGCWVYFHSFPSGQFENLVGDREGASDWSAMLYRTQDNQTLRPHVQTGGSATSFDSNTTLSTGQWYFVTQVAGSGNLRLYVDGLEDGASPVSFTGSLDNPNNQVYIGDDDSEFGPDATIEDAFWISGELSATDVEALYDRMTAGALTTGTKSFVLPRTPDLINLDYNLNGQSITLDIIGSPGEPGEETVSQALNGATSYPLTWSSSHQDFRIDIQLSTSDPETSPTFSSATLKG